MIAKTLFLAETLYRYSVRMFQDHGIAQDLCGWDTLGVKVPESGPSTDRELMRAWTRDARRPSEPDPGGSSG